VVASLLAEDIVNLIRTRGRRTLPGEQSGFGVSCWSWTSRWPRAPSRSTSTRYVVPCLPSRPGNIRPTSTMQGRTRASTSTSRAQQSSRALSYTTAYNDSALAKGFW